MTHELVEKENSLTTPSDRDLENRWRPEQGEKELTEEEVKEAMKYLNEDKLVTKFPALDRKYVDPPVAMQNIALFSFTPAKGATPNSEGIFGFAKVRGSFNTNIEADERAEYLIRNVDSYHKVYHLYVGRPFPLTIESKFSADTKEVDLRKEVAKAVSANIKEQKKDEEQTIQEIRNREEALVTESRADPEDVDPYDEYITLKVKKAQLSWTYLEHLKKIQEIRGILVKTRKTLAELDEKYPEFQTKYYDKYMKARETAGLSDKAEGDANFLKFLVEDTNLPGIDEVIVLDPSDINKETVATSVKEENLEEID